MVKISRENFSKWYNEILEKAEIVDLRYPVKGMPVYMPRGFSYLKKIFNKLETLLDLKSHKQVLFPLLIAEEEFRRESEHIKGFEAETFITQEEERKLIIRPTSETSMYPIFKLWLQSHAQLPFKVHQTCCVYRCETKATRPLIRGREVFWNEAHTVHSTYSDAEKQVLEAISIYSELFDSLFIKYKILVRPDHDKFPGAVYTVAFDTLMPDGKTLQIGTVHHLGQNFSKAYDIRVLTENGTREYVNQTCYGVSMRLLAAVLSIHGDEKGLVLPSWLAEYEGVIIPIQKRDSTDLTEYIRGISEILNKDYRIIVDNSEKSPGEKHYYWELMGIPLRIEIGEHEQKNNQIQIKTRLGQKLVLQVNQLTEAPMKIREILRKQDEAIYEKASRNFDVQISKVNEVRELEKKLGFAICGWCESSECEEHIRQKYQIEARGWEFNEKFEKKTSECIVCGKNGFEYFFGKPY